MAEIIKTFPINLDLKRVTAQSTPISPLVVGDNGNIFEITLTDGGVPVNLTGCKVFAVFSRPDGQTVEQDTDGNGVTIGGENNNVLSVFQQNRRGHRQNQSVIPQRQREKPPKLSAWQQN